jgi:hypothetical protein
VSATPDLIDLADIVLLPHVASGLVRSRVAHALAGAGMLIEPRTAEPTEEPSVTDTAPDLAAQVAALREGQRVRLVYGPKDGNTLTVEGVLRWGSIGHSVTVGAGTSSLVVRNANGSPHPDLIAVEVRPPLPTGVGAVIDATVERDGKRVGGVRCMRNEDGIWVCAEFASGYHFYHAEHIVAVERVIDPGEERS